MILSEMLSSFGYRTCIHNSLIGSEYEQRCREECDFFTELACRGWSYNDRGKWLQRQKSYGSGYKPNWYRRGVLGHVLRINQIEIPVTFKRLSKNRRIFGCVPIDLLVDLDGNPITMENKGCRCPEHAGATRCRMIEPYDETNYTTISEGGFLKG